MSKCNECWFVKPLLEWWEDLNERKSYPWRNTRDPYAIIVAEILLQRTKRDAVIKVFNDFLKKYPNAKALSKSNPDELKRIIGSLGLTNVRVKLLLNFAKVAAEKGIPKDYNELTKLPGVGDYTASMVMSLAYGKDFAAVDKNVARIFIRLFDLTPANADRPQDDPTVRKIAEKCLPSGKAKEYNLALVDLGWYICRPKKPLCDICPLRTGCLYFLKVKRGKANKDLQPRL